MCKLALTTLLLAAAGALAGCSGSSAEFNPPGSIAAAGGSMPSSATFDVRVVDITGTPIERALIDIAADAAQWRATTDRTGYAVFPNLPTRELTVSISAPLFETETFTIALTAGIHRYQFSLRAEGAWAIGRAIVLGTRMVERADDGSSMTFSADIAVVDQHSQALLTLTSADFALYQIDCGWGGPRDCASDAAGNASGGGGFAPDGPALSFGLQPPLPRRPYRVAIVAERSSAITDWSSRIPALKSFFAMLGGNDSASLSTLQMENGVPTLTALGPFTSDGRIYVDAIDALASSAGDPPPVLAALTESILRIAATRNDPPGGTDLSVLVLATPWMDVAEIDAITALAQRVGVRVSTIGKGEFGFSETAMRTGGFVAEIDDPRQLGIVLGATDQALAGVLPFYRMEFRVRGSRRTFVPGGNAKVRLRVDVPTPLRARGIHTTLDVAIR